MGDSSLPVAAPTTLKFSFSKSKPSASAASTGSKSKGQPAKDGSKSKSSSRLSPTDHHDEDTNHDEDDDGVFGTGLKKSGASVSTVTPPVLVIPVQKNKDWRSEALEMRKPRQKSALPVPPKQQVVDEKAIKSEPKIGLTVAVLDNLAKDTTDTPAQPTVSTDPVPLTDEERAIRALRGDDRVDHSGLVLPVSVTEADTDAFDRDVRTAPERPTLAQYEAIPVDGFGAALLRGMGWKDGQDISSIGPKPSTESRAKQPKQPGQPPKSRPALLGIGATSAETLGSNDDITGNTTRGRRTGPDGPKPGAAPTGRRIVRDIYTPVMLRNKRTGEMVTEEEVERRKSEREKNLETRQAGKSDDGSKRQRMDGGHDRSRGSDHGRDRDPQDRVDRSERRYSDDRSGRSRAERRDRDGDDKDRDRRDLKYRDRDDRKDRDRDDRRDRGREDQRDRDRNHGRDRDHDDNRADRHGRKDRDRDDRKDRDRHERRDDRRLDSHRDERKDRHHHHRKDGSRRQETGQERPRDRPRYRDT